MSCVYAILVGLLVERQLTLGGLPDLFIRAVRTSAINDGDRRGVDRLRRLSGPLGAIIVTNVAIGMAGTDSISRWMKLGARVRAIVAGRP